MKKAVLFILVFLGILIFGGKAYAPNLLPGREIAPEVRYIVPEDDSEVELTDNDILIFRWKPTPIPAGGRECYKFALYRDFEYDLIFSEELDSEVTSIEIPCDMFEDGEIYTWQVQQQVSRGGEWSPDLRWSFKVKKIE